MTATQMRQRKLLREYKYPDESEAQAKIHYYKEARQDIARFHLKGKDKAWLRGRADQLEIEGEDGPKMRKVRLRNNARALREYAHHFGDKQYEVLDGLRLRLRFNDVQVNVVPDLHVRENGHEKIIKLEFAVNEPTSDLVRIVSQCLFEAAYADGHRLPSASVLFVDVPRGHRHKGARLGSRMGGNIQAACQNISAIWDRI